MKGSREGAKVPRVVLSTTRVVRGGQTSIRPYPVSPILESPHCSTFFSYIDKGREEAWLCFKLGCAKKKSCLYTPCV